MESITASIRSSPFSLRRRRLTTFLSQELVGQGGFSRVNSPDVSVWLSAGIQGRFDLFGAVARRCGWLARMDRKQCLEAQRCRRQDWSENIVVGQQDTFQRAAIFRRRGRIRLVRPVVAAIDSLGAERG